MPMSRSRGRFTSYFDRPSNHSPDTRSALWPKLVDLIPRPSGLVTAFVRTRLPSQDHLASWLRSSERGCPPKTIWPRGCVRQNAAAIATVADLIPRPPGAPAIL